MSELETKDEIEQRAIKTTDRKLWSGAGLLAGWWGFTAYGTWWIWSWDVMEPVTYMATYSVVCCGYLYFLYTKTEYTFTGLRARMSRRRQDKLLTRNGFDLARHEELEAWMKQNGVVLTSTGVKSQEQISFDPEEILRVFNQFDKDGSGELSQTEWRKVAEEISKGKGRAGGLEDSLANLVRK